jgi:integrase/recombinase XerD
LADIKNKVVFNQEGDCFFKYTETIAKQFDTTGHFGNAVVYRQCASFVKWYSGLTTLPMNELNIQLLRRLELAYLSKGLSENGLSNYMRTVRAIYNRAIEEGQAKSDFYPFKKYVMPSEKKVKDYIQKDQISLIANHPLIQGSPEWKYKSYWLFMYQCSGMSIGDMARLKVGSVGKDHIVYIRNKTKKTGGDKQVVVKIQPKALETLNYFKEGKSSDSFVFPIIKTPYNPEKWRDQIHNVGKYMSKFMDRLALELDINIHITSKIARHSWANVARQETDNPQLIQQSLGHGCLKTTEIYLGSFSNAALDDLSNRVSEI